MAKPQLNKWEKPRKPVNRILGVEDKKIFQKQEDDTALRANGTKTIASGALAGFKGDVVTDNLLIENKITSKDSISVKKEVLVKISFEAKSYGKLPVLAFGFDRINPLVDKTWWAMPEDLAAKMLEHCKRTGFNFHD